MSKQSIEIDPKKIKSIIDMLPPHDLKTLRSLQGKIHTIDHFVSQFFDKYHPFNELLKKGMVFEWSEKYQKAFDEIKYYLTTAPILVPPKDGIHF